MPELPEVETVARGLEPVLCGRRFARVEQRRPDLRFPLPERFAERLQGRKVVRIARRAKYILVHLDSQEVLAIHLGMTGRFSVAAARAPSPRLRGEGRGEGQRHTAAPEQAPAPHPNPLPTEEWGEGIQLGQYTYEHGRDAKHDHLVFTMSGGAIVTYNDARRFGYMTLIPERDLARDAFFAGLGVEPLSEELGPAYLARRAAGRRSDLKAFLMDQRIVAGLGNIYVCEALFRAGLSPFKPAARLATRTGKPTPAAERLSVEIKAVLEDAIRAGGSTLRDYKRADGSLGSFQNEFRIYGREAETCSRPRCGGKVCRKTQGGRSTFFCPACQR
jgi:formamidopyrimidine-DNA glycosylase